jgi:hypothetical protein
MASSLPGSVSKIIFFAAANAGEGRALMRKITNRADHASSLKLRGSEYLSVFLQNGLAT